MKPSMSERTPGVLTVDTHPGKYAVVHDALPERLTIALAPDASTIEAASILNGRTLFLSPGAATACSLMWETIFGVSMETGQLCVQAPHFMHE